MADYYDDRQAYEIHTAVGEVVDPEIGSFGPHSGRPKNANINGIQAGLFADYVILTLTKPLISLPSLLDEI
ncbi:Hypothetical predicted protein [Pelobates cultripes]|uniref:Uncharacterized protein n=1 Tax=Pelobates cultripes TaxID=61616 RepID=A0AAD1WHI4_PELCU|nr:Hypothetical predicted protein [Pelobates cultripes]